MEKKKVTNAHLRLSDEEKEELFTDFMLRFAEMDKKDKREVAARNARAMKDLTKYWYDVSYRSSGDHIRYDDIPDGKKYMYRIYDGRPYFAADGLYDAYLAIRKVVPYAVGAKRSLEGQKIAGSYPGYKRTYVMDPEKDTDEATEIGKRLLDTLIEYLKETEKEPGYSKEDSM
jgi:hypothetical protein